MSHERAMASAVGISRRVAAVACVACVTLVCRWGAAESNLPVVLDYRAPLECPDKQVVTARTAALVRHQPSAPLAATVTITHEAAGYRLELHLEGGNQAIVSQSCESLVKTLTVVLALAADPLTQRSMLLPVAQGAPRGEPQAPTGAPAGAPAEPGPAASSIVTRPATTALPRTQAIGVRGEPAALEATTKSERHPSSSGPVPSSVSVKPSVELHPVLLLITEYGMLPQLAHGPSVGLWVDRGNWSLVATAIWLMPAWAQMPGTEQARGGHISFLGAGTELCGVLHAQLIRSCAGIEAGDMMGKGSGVSNGQVGHGVWLAPVASVGIRPKFWAMMGADLRVSFAVPVKRPAFGFDGFNWRFEPHAWSIRLASGFSWF